VGLLWRLVEGVREPRYVPIISRAPRETRARSLIVALAYGLFWGLLAGLVLGLNNGGWFVLLQKVAYRRLARAGNLPPRPADFLEWGIEKQIFRRVGGGARFRHGLIQQHLANTSGAAP
jgi:hypothetical protein